MYLSMMKTMNTGETRNVRMAKTGLLILLCVFTAASLIFSLYVLFGDFGGNKEVSPAQARGLFTVFVYENLNEVHPNRLPLGRSWQVTSLDFPNKNFAVVEATDGQTRSKLEFIYIIEYPNVRVLKINDITGRDLQDANLALIRYLTFLQNGDYENAAVSYGGSIARLVPYGADDASLPKLLEGYCMKASVVQKCLPFTITNARKDLETGSYRFTVTYRLPDNTPFKLLDGTSSFNAIVESPDTSSFRVTTLPFDH